MSYASYQAAIQPTFLKDPAGQAFMRAQGLVKDFLFSRLKQGVLFRFPGYASDDALGAIGDERLIDKGTSPQLATPETDAAYAQRLINAWAIWALAGTAWGMLNAFLAQGYRPTIIQQNGLRFNLDGSNNLVVVVGAPWTFAPPNLWNTFLVLLPTVPSSWTNIHNPATDTSAPSANEIARLVRIINLWRPGHMICAGLQVITSGSIWGYGNWGSPRTWGGTTTVFPVPASSPL